MTDIIKSKDYIDSFADVFITTGMKVGDNEYCRITFCRHILDSNKTPDSDTIDSGINLYLESTQSVTIPMSMAKNMAQAILNAPIADTDLITPFEKKY
ncbi:hypothetical protein ACMU9U_003593 [Yersinia enterocolitica]|nr:hypothetical protein [Yersinia enterocolitica]HEF7268401.1 hypothetical protein [Yersinia enterocolitica]